MWPFRKKSSYNVLPYRQFSYVVGKNGEPLVTYYSDNIGLFCSAPLSAKDKSFFLNIRRPVVIDVGNVANVVIPKDLPKECDGIIFKNYGVQKITAFYVKDKNTQTMCLG